MVAWVHKLYATLLLTPYLHAYYCVWGDCTVYKHGDLAMSQAFATSSI